MNESPSNIIKLENSNTELFIDPFGGAITSFRLKNININPLSFSFPKAQMPANNQSGAVYQGHFLCLGRWGEPSAGEIKAGIPNHGEIANILWKVTEKSGSSVKMETLATKEGLKVLRTLLMDKNSALYLVNEKITNINPLGRLYNVVQHPSLAEPFLDEDTVINCNADKGFNQNLYKDISSNIINWPTLNSKLDSLEDIENGDSTYHSVYSFIVKQDEEYGWVTAFSQKHNLLFGYIWKREDYPWIHLWQCYVDKKIKYRGIEFGTAGIHQPFNEILNTALNVFGEKTLGYIDAGETISKKYLSFIHSTPNNFSGVEDIYLTKNKLIIKTLNGQNDININFSEEIANEL